MNGSDPFAVGSALFTRKITSPEYEAGSITVFSVTAVGASK